MTNLTHLRRLRWIVRLALALGVGASIAANVLHARDSLISQTIAAWPPLALLLTVELMSRVPAHRRALAAVRITATGVIAAIAAWVSYWHMAGVTARYGETSTSAHLMPLSVDGLILVASISLVELGGHIRTLDPAPTPQTSSAPTKPTTTTARSPAGTANPAGTARPGKATTPAKRSGPRKSTTPTVRKAPAGAAV